MGFISDDWKDLETGSESSLLPHSMPRVVVWPLWKETNQFNFTYSCISCAGFLIRLSSFFSTNLTQMCPSYVLKLLTKLPCFTHLVPRVGRKQCREKEEQIKKKKKIER